MSIELFKQQTIQDLGIAKATPTLTDEEWIAFANKLSSSQCKNKSEATHILLGMFNDKKFSFYICKSVDNTDLNTLLMLAIQVNKT